MALTQKHNIRTGQSEAELGFIYLACMYVYTCVSADVLLSGGARPSAHINVSMTCRQQLKPWASTWASVVKWTIDINMVLGFFRTTDPPMVLCVPYISMVPWGNKAQGHHQGIRQWHRLHMSTWLSWPPTVKLHSLLLYNYTFVTVMNYNVNISLDRGLPKVENYWVF